MKQYIITGILLSCILTCSAQKAGIHKLDNGDRVSWDGEYYDFRDSAGVKMIKLWVPPNVEYVRGIFISGHGGGGGDSRHFARDENLRAFAMRLGFGIAGIHNFPGRRAYNEGAEVFFNTLEKFAALGLHPELANVPFVMYGSSNGGATTYGFVNYAPERAICFVANVSAGYRPEIPVKTALEVPGIFIIGKFDALIGQRGIDRTEQLIRDTREKGARWCWALELKGHEDGYSFDIYMKLVEQAVKMRYPTNENPSKGPVTLRVIREEDGWLVDQSTWESGLTTVYSYDSYDGMKENVGWALNEDIARVYQGLATHHNPIKIKILEFDRTYNPNTDPGTMFSLGGPVVNPNDRITIQCNLEAFPSWKKLAIYNGSEMLGKVTESSKPEITVTLSDKNQVYCLTAEAEDSKGKIRVSDPLHFFVRDPSLNWKRDLTPSSFASDKTNAGISLANSGAIPHDADPNDSILVAYGLSAIKEKQFSSVDGELSDFWGEIDETKDHISLTQRNNAARDAAFNFVLTHDCNMLIKAAYGADGIYLLMTMNDDNDVAWPNELSGTENEQFYLHYDAVDLIMDSRDIQTIADPENRDMMLSRSFGLTTTTRQYQVACGTEKQRPEGFKRSMADPWDFHSKYFTFADAKQLFGIQIENLKTDHFYKVQEWFIPWSEVGGGLEGEPEPGTRIAFTAGFNDRDDGEHFPPGVTSSGGSVKASNSLRWINRSDPWGSNNPPYNWGELLFGIPLEN